MLKNIAFRDILYSIIKSVDTINPILKNHHRRTAIISYHIGKAFGLEKESLTNLVLTASLHDVGALTVKDSQMLVSVDVEDPVPHSILGAKMLSSYNALNKISKIIRYHHIKYSEYEKKKDLVPVESLILHLADRIEILLNSNDLALNQVLRVKTEIEKRSREIFDPKLVDVFMKLSEKEIFWFDIDNLTTEELLDFIDIDSIFINHDFDDLENLVYTLSRIIDYKSPFTVTHSIGVAHIAYHLAKLYGLDEEVAREIKIAGYLHDIGKIAVPSELLSKPSGLNKKEFNEVKSHVYFTEKIIGKIKGFENISKWAGTHHESLDGKGYPKALESTNLTVESLIVAYADIFCALSEDRPYRKALPLFEIKNILENEFKKKLGEEIFLILEKNMKYLDKERKMVQKEAYENYIKKWID